MLPASSMPLRFVDPDGHDPEPAPDPQDPCGCKLTPKPIDQLLTDLENRWGKPQSKDRTNPNWKAKG